MKSMNLKTILTPLLLTFLILGVFWIYTQVELKKFEDSLPKAPPVQTENSETAPTAQGEEPQEVTEVTTDTQVPAVSGTPSFKAETERSEPDTSESTASADYDHLDIFLEYLETTEAEMISSGDITDVSQDAPYDQEIVHRGFEDYNFYLETDPEYAYQRLDAAWREQYGDDPDVSRLVEYVRLTNEDTVTIDQAIAYQEIMRRLVSKGSPPEALDSIDNHLQTLLESQKMAMEAGLGVTYTFEFVIGE